MWLGHQLFPSRSQRIILRIVLLICCVYLFMGMWGRSVEIRRQLEGVDFLFLHVGSWGRTEAVRLGCKGVYPLSPLRSSALFTDFNVLQALVP